MPTKHLSLFSLSHSHSISSASGGDNESVVLWEGGGSGGGSYWTVSTKKPPLSLCGGGGFCVFISCFVQTIWSILPVVICFFQGLSHACLRENGKVRQASFSSSERKRKLQVHTTVDLRMAHYISNHLCNGTGSYPPSVRSNPSSIDRDTLPNWMANTCRTNFSCRGKSWWWWSERNGATE